jgi:hypothetical protein
MDPLPHLEAMNRDLFIDLEAQPHLAGLNVEHGDFEQALEAAGASHHNCFQTFPRQDQHGQTLLEKSNQS